MLHLASLKIVLETAFVSERVRLKCQSAVGKCVSYLVCEWSAYYKVWISGAGAALCSAAKLPTHKTFTLQIHLLSGPGCCPDQNYYLHFFTAEVTGSRAERMQVQCNIVRTLHSANITSSSLQVAGARGG